MRLNLPDSILSTQDLKTVILDIRRYAQWLAQVSVKTQVVGGDPYAPPVISHTALDLMKDWQGGEAITQQSLDDLIAELKDLSATAPTMTISLAGPPSASLKKSLTAWCRQHIDRSILVDFAFNATMLGGMVVRYGSHIYDWSFRRQILAARGRFPEVLRRV